MATTLPAAAVPVSVKMPEPITAPIPSAVRLQGPKVRRSFLSGSSEAAISASMLLVRKMLKFAARRPASACAGPAPGGESFFFWEPRATPAARLALGAAFLRDVRA